MKPFNFSQICVSQPHCVQAMTHFRHDTSLEDTDVPSNFACCDVVTNKVCDEISWLVRSWLGFRSRGGFEDCGLETFGCETGQACTPSAGPCICSTCTKVRARPAHQRHVTASTTPDLVLAFANDPTSLPYEPVDIAKQIHRCFQCGAFMAL